LQSGKFTPGEKKREIKNEIEQTDRVKEEGDRRQKERVRDEEQVKKIKLKGAAGIERAKNYTCKHDCPNPVEFQGPCGQTTPHSKPRC
jgi:hypothetical protein